MSTATKIVAAKLYNKCQKKYVCTQCSAFYESPNPLKLHLTLGCGKQTMVFLWEKLSDSWSDIKKNSTFNFQLMDAPLITKQSIAIDLSTPSKEEELLGNRYSNSAFKPFKKKLSSTPAVSLRQNYNPYNSLSAWPHSARVSSESMGRTQQMPESISYECTDGNIKIETLIRSMSKYNEGHICLYCGKSYSRKYGLKIHIRTHTGYKPLKCKYCLRPFGDPSNLNKHVRLHAEGETPYKCDICGKVLVRRRDLERHIKSRHSGDLTTNPLFCGDESVNFIHSSDDEKKINKSYE